MKFTTKILALFFVMFIFIGSTVTTASAQRRVRRVIYRPVVVSPYYYNSLWYWNRWNNPYYGDSYFYDPRLSERRERLYLQRELEGNKEELRKHLEKYNADGVITAKERKELDDDYRDVARAERELKAFNGE